MPVKELSIKERLVFVAFVILGNAVLVTALIYGFRFFGIDITR